MKTKPNDIVYDDNIHRGLTKREYFAAMALQGFCGSDQSHLGSQWLAQYAVNYADALIEELNKEEEENDN